MSRFLRSVWIWSATLVLILVWTPLLAIVRLFDIEPLHLRTGRWFRLLGRVVAKVNPWRLDFAGSEHIDPDQTYVIVSNHQSFADIPVMAHLRLDMKYMAKAELFRFPILGWMLRMAGDVAVDRTDRRKAATAMLRCARYLRQRCSVMFFPEGTRSEDGMVLPFNDGPFQLAIRENVRVLPVVVEGSGSALPRNSWLFSDRQKIQIRVLKAISVDGWDLKRTGELRDMVRQTMVDELSRLRAAA